MSRSARSRLSPHAAIGAVDNLGALKSRVRCTLWAALTIISATGFCGCSSLRDRLYHRSAECSQLCEEARSARDAGRTVEAERYLNAAVRQRPTDAETQLQLAEELWSSGRQLAAAEKVAQVLEASPSDLQAAIRLAEMQLEIGRTEAAYQAIMAAFRIDPTPPDVLRLKAILEERRGDTDAALATALRLVDTAPDDVEAMLHLAHLYRRRGQANRAAPLLRSARQHALATSEQRLEAGWQLGLAYADVERWNDASELMQQVAKSRPFMTAEDWYQYANVEWHCSHADQAALALNHALALQPKHAGAVVLARAVETARSNTAVLPAGFRSEPAREIQ